MIYIQYPSGYAVVSAPIERLKMKEVPFMWNDKCKTYPDFSERFKLYVDSSKSAVANGPLERA
ncbi:hypothetical protein PHMEG_00010995 [Phytophthora megakarya]|uniref:Uncharacterized protein n=1 Tax=Phytophthora megakarya TaxID=4795 RepID=A0A225WDA1_9STRA|nr:hypothetical protein PHMEG_00010995 [Phytophthora megakarya]